MTFDNIKMGSITTNCHIRNSNNNTTKSLFHNNYSRKCSTMTSTVTTSSSSNYSCYRLGRYGCLAIIISTFLLSTLLLNDVNLLQLRRRQQSFFQNSLLSATSDSDTGSMVRIKSQESLSSNSIQSDSNVYSQLKYPKQSKSDSKELKMIWLMSFPNSGTSYTSQLIMEMTRTDAATNYADEMPMNSTINKIPYYRKPIYKNLIDGPFWYKPEMTNPNQYTKPKEYIITKTHCGLRCTVCAPEKYGESTYSFRQRCFTTVWTDHIDTETGKVTKKTGLYPPDHLYKAIHIVRDPFDNIVSRFHYDQELVGRLATQYPRTREGFRNYCRATDDVHKVNEKKIVFLDDSILDIMKDVPCHADFFRYVEWHNLAFITTKDLNLETHVLKYDDYTIRFNETMKELLDFIQIPIHPKGEIPPFITGKVYREYYTIDEQRAVAKALEIMSSAETWFHIRHYFLNHQIQ